MFLKTPAAYLLIILLIAGCNKKTENPPPQHVFNPIIKGFEIVDECNRSLKIEGLDFNPDVSKDSVLIGEKKMKIDSVNKEELFITFPLEDVSGIIKVYCSGHVAEALEPFVFVPPFIDRFSPTKAGPGAILTISGRGFGESSASDSVFIDNKRAEILSVKPDEIKVRVPDSIKSAYIQVFNNCRQVLSKDHFTFLNKGIIYASSNSGICYAIDITSQTANWAADVHSRYLSGPAYSNGVVFIGSSDNWDLDNNYMYALDAIDGKVLWKYKSGPYDGIAVVQDDIVYAAGWDRNLNALNAKTGELIWTNESPDYFRDGGPTYYDHKIYVGNYEHVCCFDAATGAEIYRSRIYPNKPGGNLAVGYGMVYTAGEGTLYALDAITGAVRWTSFMAYLSNSSPILANGKVYIGSQFHTLYCIDAYTGETLWETNAGGNVASALCLDNNRLYVHTVEGILKAVDAENGTEIWKKDVPGIWEPGASPLIVDRVLYVGDINGKLNAIDPETGADLWSFKLGEVAVVSSPCVVDAHKKAHYAGDSGNL